MNPFRLVSFLPYIVFALQKANAPPSKEQNGDLLAQGIGNMNLANALQDPENLKKLFAQKTQGELAIDSMKILAGQKASAVVDKILEEVKNSASDRQGGVTGISGKHLIDVLKRSDSLKKLFQTDELTVEGLNYMNFYVDSYLSPELKNVKSEVFTEINDRAKNRQNDEGVNNNSVTKTIRGTISDSVAAFFKVGYKKMNEKLVNLSSDADKNVVDWQKMANGESDGTPTSTTSRLKSIIINNTPTAILKMLATGNVFVKNQLYLIPKVAAFFLPIGLPMDVLHFICLVTYVMLMAQRESIMPEIDKDKIKMLSGLNTETIIDKLNSNDIMAKIFPLNDHSNVRVGMLKFLAGPEANIVDALVDELKKMKRENGGGYTSIYDLLKNAEFFKKLFAMKERADAVMKNYLGVDVGQLQNEIADEYDKNNDGTDGPREDVSIYNLVPRGSAAVTGAVSATYRVGLRKANEQVENINGRIAEEAERMTQTPHSTSGESYAAGLFRRVASVAPTSVQYGLAGAKIAAGRLSSFYWGTDGGGGDRRPTTRPDDNDGS